MTTLVRDRKLNKLYPEYVNYKTTLALIFSNYIPEQWVKKISSLWTSNCSKQYLTPYKSLPGDIQKFIEEYRVNTEELKIQDVNQYRTFNDWFQRELKMGVRPINPQSLSIVSPADCRIRAEISDLTSSVTVKGSRMNWNEVLGTAYGDVQGLSNLYFCRLAYQDYHRFHMPFGGTVVDYSMLGVAHYPVHKLYKNQNKLKDNVRCVLRVISPKIGKWIIVIVGAACVGSIDLRDKIRQKKFIQKGEEIGMFGLGGSAMILVFPHDKVEPDDDLLSPFIETVVKVGEKIGKCK